LAKLGAAILLVFLNPEDLALLLPPAQAGGLEFPPFLI
jgi:hypothetical protein